MARSWEVVEMAWRGRRQMVRSIRDALVTTSGWGRRGRAGGWGGESGRRKWEEKVEGGSGKRRRRGGGEGVVRGRGDTGSEGAKTIRMGKGECGC